MTDEQSNLEVITSRDILAYLISRLRDPTTARQLELGDCGVDFLAVARAIRTGVVDGADLAIAELAIRLGIVREDVLQFKGMDQPVLIPISKLERLRRSRVSHSRNARFTKLFGVRGLANRVWRIRRGAGLTLDDAATIMGCSPATVEQVEAEETTESQIVIFPLYRFLDFVGFSMPEVVESLPSSRLDFPLFRQPLADSEHSAARALAIGAPRTSIAQYRAIADEISKQYDEYLETAGRTADHFRRRPFHVSDADVIRILSRVSAQSRQGGTL